VTVLTSVFDYCGLMTVFAGNCSVAVFGDRVDVRV